MKDLSFTLLLLSLALSGCGQPGPLYLPGTKPPFYVPPEEVTEPEAKDKEVDKVKESDENKEQDKDLQQDKVSEPDKNITNQELTTEPQPQPVPESKQPEPKQ